MSLLVTQIKDNELVPFRDGLKVYELVNPPKQLPVIHGGHNTWFLDGETIYQHEIDQFSISFGL